MSSFLCFNILDCSFQRKVKPIQNLSIIIFAICWIFIFILIFIPYSWAVFLFYIFLIISGLSLLLFISLSLFFIRKNRIGVVKINKDIIMVNNSKYRANECFIDLNVNASESIKKLPFWGNYIVLSDNKNIEFEPNKDMEKLVDCISVSNSKRSALSMKTTDLFNNLMSFLWAAS